MRIVQEILPTQLAQTSKLKVAAYARVSSDSDDQKHSYAAQVAEYTERISENDEWTFVDIYADEGITGTRMDKRDDLNRMLKDCRRGKIDLILIKSISRFARNNKECIETIRELKSMDVGVIFESENIDTRQMSSETIASLYSTLAQEESLKTSKRVRQLMQERMQNGEYKTNSTPYGYTQEDGKWLISYNEAEIVREIYDDFLMGKGKKEIAQSLNARKVPRKSGKWRIEAIAYILSNEKYVGDTLLQKRFTTDTLPFKRKLNHGDMDMIMIRNTHEPIITRETFEKVQKLIKQRALDGNSNPHCGKIKYPLTSKIRCANCGKNYLRRIFKNGIGWGCTTYEQLGKDKCHAPRIMETEVYDAFIRLCQKLKLHPQILSSLLAGLQDAKTQNTRYDGELIEINKKIAELKQQHETFIHIKSAGLMDTAILMSQIDGVNAQMRELQTQRRHLMDDDNDESIPKTKEIIAVLNAVDENAKFNPLIFNNMVQKIIISETELTFRLKNGLELKENYMKRSR